MSNKTDFSVNIDINPSSRLKPLPDWIVFDLCNPYPLPDNKLLLHNTRNGKRAMVNPEVFASLACCSTFQTLETHVKNVAELQPMMQDHQGEVRSALKQMLTSGIMRSAKDIIQELKPGPDATTDTPVDNKKPVAAVITWERPRALERLLTSVATNCETSELHCFYVIDDSRTNEHIEQNRALVKKFTDQFDTPLHYIGQAKQQSFIEALVAIHPQHENAIRYLTDQKLWVNQWTCGMARNWAMLLSCGRRLVVMDDDVICDVYEPTQSKAQYHDLRRSTRNGFFC